MLIKLLKLDNLLLSLIILFISTSLTYSEEVFIEIDNPRFSEKGLSDKTYEIKAEKGLKSDNELTKEREIVGSQHLPIYNYLEDMYEVNAEDFVNDFDLMLRVFGVFYVLHAAYRVPSVAVDLHLFV